MWPHSLSSGRAGRYPMPTCVCNPNYEQCPYHESYPARLKPGMVILSEGQRSDPVSKSVAWATGSWFTHVLIVTGPNEAVEAWVPRVRRIKLSDRLRQLRAEKRAFAIMDLPGMTRQQRCDIVKLAHNQVGKFYDFGQAFIFAVWRRFWRDGSGTVVCSRLITHLFNQIGEELFPDELLARRADPSLRRLDDIREGAIVPKDLLISRLKVVRWKSSPTMKTWKGLC